MKIDHSSSVPLGRQIELLLREEIKRPQYQRGEKLVREVDMAQDLGVSRATLRQAISKLVFDGLLIRKKGYGTVVSKKTISSKAINWMSFSQEMKMLNVQVKNYELHVSWEVANRELMDFFDIKQEGTQILKLERLRGNTDKPFVYFISYFNPNIGLSNDEDFLKPLYEIMENKYNVLVDVSKEEISAKLADSFLAKKFSIEVGDPILKRMRLVYDVNGMAVEWNEGLYEAGSFVYSLELKRQIKL